MLKNEKFSHLRAVDSDVLAIIICGKGTSQRRKGILQFFSPAFYSPQKEAVPCPPLLLIALIAKQPIHSAEPQVKGGHEVLIIKISLKGTWQQNRKWKRTKKKWLQSDWSCGGSDEFGEECSREPACSGGPSGAFVSGFWDLVLPDSVFWTQSGNFDDLEGEVSDEWTVEEFLW